MAHSHEHAHDPGSYYVEQLCTIGICGALGGVAVMLYVRGLLSLLIIPIYHIPVMAGGAVLLAVVVLRAISVWSAAGALKGGHVHGPDCDHGHGHAHGTTEVCDHTHGHGHAHGQANVHAHAHGEAVEHDHSWAPWRYVVLLLPVVLYFLNLPNEGFIPSLELGNIQVEAGGDITGNADGRDLKIGFLELERASFTREQREFYEGGRVTLEGVFVPHNGGKSFGLVRYKMNCCAADSIPLSAVTMMDPKAVPEDEKLPEGLSGKWVRVTGIVQFRQRADRPGAFVTVVYISPEKGQTVKDLLVPISQPANPFLF